MSKKTQGTARVKHGYMAYKKNESFDLRPAKEQKTRP